MTNNPSAPASPTPWTIKQNTRGVVRIEDANGEIVVVKMHSSETVPHWTNADRIVEAVNTHATLQEQLEALTARLASLHKELSREAQAHLRTIDQRDQAEAAADALAYEIASQDVIGEHSSANDPWRNASEQLQIERDAHTTQLAERSRQRDEAVKFATHIGTCRAANCRVCGRGTRMMSGGDCSCDKYGTHQFVPVSCTCGLDALLASVEGAVTP